MVQSTSIIIASVLAVLLLGLAETQAERIQEKCTEDSNCKSGVCQDGICQAQPPDPILCGNNTCQKGEYCEFPWVKCVEGVNCTIPPPKCVTLIDQLSEKSIDPCGNQCGRGSKCQLFAPICDGLRCRPPRAKCVSSNFYNPCAATSCSQGAACYPNEKDPRFGECTFPGNPCATVGCKLGYECQIVLSYCNKTPCAEPYGECVPRDPCAITTCGEGFECKRSKENPSEAQCQLKDLCPKVKCKRGYECKMVVLYCIKAPCPAPYPSCVPKNPCIPNNCPRGYACAPSKEDITKPKCYATEPCRTVECKAGYECKAIVRDCLGSVCPEPYGVCFPINNPCSNATCVEPNICTQTEKDPTVAECVLNPCAYVRCGGPCRAVTEYCVTPPCPRPQAVCESDLEEDPCALVDCVGTCRKVEVTECEKPPCRKYKAVCEKNPCDDVYCEKGKECIVKTLQCINPPCDLVPFCMCKNEIIT